MVVEGRKACCYTLIHECDTLQAILHRQIKKISTSIITRINKLNFDHIFHQKWDLYSYKLPKWSNGYKKQGTAKTFGVTKAPVIGDQNSLNLTGFDDLILGPLSPPS